MTEFAFAYVVAIFALLLSGTSALTLIYAVNHFDPPETPPRQRGGEPRSG